MFLGNTAVHSNKGEEKNTDSDDGNGETDGDSNNEDNCDNGKEKQEKCYVTKYSNSNIGLNNIWRYIQNKHFHVNFALERSIQNSKNRSTNSNTPV